MSRSERLSLGIVLERRRSRHPWQDHAWRPVAVLPGAPAVDEPRLLQHGEGWAWYHMATLDLELFPSETEGYRYNLSQARPVIYAMWRDASGEPEGWPAPFLVTACPYEAQDYLDGDDVTVEGVPMPEAVAQWIVEFVARHHVERPFAKRRRKPHDTGAPHHAPTREDERG
jgi:hypothetical protein